MPEPCRDSWGPMASLLNLRRPVSLHVPAAMEAQMAQAAERLKSLGGEQVTIDFAPFAETAVLLYGAPFVAERYAGGQPG